MRRRRCFNDAYQILLGQRIRARREALQFAPARFSDAIGISPGLLFEHEGGRVPVPMKTLVRIARQLDCSIDFLLPEPMEKNRAHKDQASSLKRTEHGCDHPDPSDQAGSIVPAWYVRLGRAPRRPIARRRIARDD